MSESQQLTLHWSPRSPFVRKVMICAYETGVEPRIERVRSVAAMTRPNQPLMLDNPLSKIPTLRTGDPAVGTLFDSRVICEYLDGLHDGPRLFPSEHVSRYAALRWQALGDGLLDATVLWRNEREREPGQQSAALLGAFEVKVRATLARIEDESEALARAPFSIGQVTVGCALGYLDFRFGDLGWRNGHPRAAAWFADVSHRPSFQRTLPTEG